MSTSVTPAMTAMSENTLTSGPQDIGLEESASINGSLFLTRSDETSIQFNALYADDDDGQYRIVLQPSSDTNCTFPNPPPSTTSRPYYCGTLRDDVSISPVGFLRLNGYRPSARDEIGMTPPRLMNRAWTNS